MIRRINSIKNFGQFTDYKWSCKNEFKNIKIEVMNNKSELVDYVLTIFNNNRKIAGILITENGTAMESPISFLTNADIIDLVKIIETY